jgi:hypothetical protein
MITEDESMKKIIFIALALVLTLSLFTACGSDDNDCGSTTPPANSTPNGDNGTGNSANYNGGASVNEYEWPDNKWTQYMPKPAGELSDDPTEDVTGSTSSTCWFTIIGGRDDAKTYVEQLIAYGYTEDPEPIISVSETDQEYRWDGISPAIDEVYHYYIMVHHFVSEFGDNNTYDIIISNHR